MAKKKVNKVKVKPVKNNVTEGNQFYMILAGMILLIGVVLLVYYLIHGRYNFEYQGLAFTKEKYGDLDVYHHYYYFTFEGEQYQYNLYLHNDPRKNKVPVEGNIVLQDGKTVYIGINSTGLNCSNNTLAVGTLSSFLVDNMLKVKGGTPNAYEAKESNKTLIQCALYPTNPVIIMQSGAETSIKQVNRTGCYEITVGNTCDILQAVEKFKVQSIIDAKKRA